MIILKISKIATTILMLSIFAVGTMTFIDTVEAAINPIDNEKEYTVESKEKSAKWIKFDSGTINFPKPDKGYRNKHSYVAYSKGSKDIRVNFYGYKIKNNKKTYVGALFLSKTGNKLTYYAIYSTGKKEQPSYSTTKMSVRQTYNAMISEMKKG